MFVCKKKKEKEPNNKKLLFAKNNCIKIFSALKCM